MATIQELAAVRSRRATLNPDGTISAVSRPTATQANSNVVPSSSPYDPPPTALGSDPSVMAAYRNLMGYNAESDAAKGNLSRRLTTNLETSKTNRGHSLLNSRQNFSDHGIMNSGIALKRMEDLNTQYDTTDNQMQNNYNTSLGDIERKKLALTNAYQDSQVQASAAEVKRQADAAAAAL